MSTYTYVYMYVIYRQGLCAKIKDFSTDLPVVDNILYSSRKLLSLVLNKHTHVYHI